MPSLITRKRIYYALMVTMLAALLYILSDRSVNDTAQPALEETTSTTNIPYSDEANTQEQEVLDLLGMMEEHYDIVLRGCAVNEGKLKNLVK